MPRAERVAYLLTHLCNHIVRLAYVWQLIVAAGHTKHTRTPRRGYVLDAGYWLSIRRRIR